MTRTLEGHQLYHFNTCPFCVRVRVAMRLMGLELPLKNIKADRAIRDELIAGGGKKQVPCLRIERAGEDPQWLYESADIIAYLRRQLAAAS